MINAINGKYALPVDEDDYLMPSPGPMSQASYIDFVGKGKHIFGFAYLGYNFSLNLGKVADCRRAPINLTLAKQQGCIDNPEYHMMNNGGGPLLNGSIRLEADHQYVNQLSPPPFTKQNVNF